MSEAGERSFTIGNVFSRSFSVMTGAAATVFGISFLFGAIPQAIWGIVMPKSMLGLQPGDFGPLMVVMVVGGILVFACSLLAQGALVRTTIDHAEGRTTSIGQAVNTGLAMILPLLAVAIITAIGVGIASILLLVPGIMLFLMWCVAVPALVDERTGVTGAFARSRELTKGFRWKIFGLFLLLIVIFWIAIMIVGVGVFTTGSAEMLASNPTAAPSVTTTIVNLILNTLIIGFWSTLINALFVELRNAKEGLAPDNLAEVFA